MTTHPNEAKGGTPNLSKASIEKILANNRRPFAVHQIYAAFERQKQLDLNKLTDVTAAQRKLTKEYDSRLRELTALQARCAELERELKASAQSLETLTTTTSDPALKVWVGNIAASHRALLATKEPDKGKE